MVFANMKLTIQAHLHASLADDFSAQGNFPEAVRAHTFAAGAVIVTLLMLMYVKVNLNLPRKVLKMPKYAFVP